MSQNQQKKYAWSWKLFLHAQYHFLFLSLDFEVRYNPDMFLTGSVWFTLKEGDSLWQISWRKKKHPLRVTLSDTSQHLKSSGKRCKTRRFYPTTVKDFFRFSATRRLKSEHISRENPQFCCHLSEYSLTNVAYSPSEMLLKFCPDLFH